MMPRTFTLAIVLSAWCLGYAASVVAGQVQCTCPSVNAEGTGNSSCSASENSSKCTVDFNFFATKDEERAREVWSNVFRGRTFAPKIDVRSWNVLVELERNESRQFVDTLVDTLLVYLLVARVQANSDRELENLSYELREVGQAVREEKSEVVQRFSFERFQQFNTADPSGFAHPSRINEALQAKRLRVAGGRYVVVVANGCIEVRGQGLWLMYKAFWSPARVLAQCTNTPDIWR